MMDKAFETRKPTWYGLGTRVEGSMSSHEALKRAGLDWRVYQRSILTSDHIPVNGYKANIRSSDRRILGIVTDKYQIIQNEEAFAFTDELLGKGVRYETAGMLQDGRKTWLLAKLPTEYMMLGDRVSPYMVFYNTHDGSGAVKLALTPIRVACQNTLNLALRKAKRTWSSKHTGDIVFRLDDAKQALFMAEDYMDKLGMEVERLSKVNVSDEMVEEFIKSLLPMPDDATSIQEKNVERLRSDLRTRYFHAPDLSHVGKNGYRLINSVSDFATHMKPLRSTESYQENLFAKTIDGNPMIDKAYEMLCEVA